METLIAEKSAFDRGYTPVPSRKLTGSSGHLAKFRIGGRKRKGASGRKRQEKERGGKEGARELRGFTPLFIVHYLVTVHISTFPSHSLFVYDGSTRPFGL